MTQFLRCRCARTASGSLPAGAKDTPPVGQVNGHHAVGELQKTFSTIASDGALTSFKAASVARGRLPNPNWIRHRNSILVTISWPDKPRRRRHRGNSDSRTIVSFSSSVKRRRLARPSRGSAAAASAKSVPRLGSLAALLALVLICPMSGGTKMRSPVDSPHWRQSGRANCAASRATNSVQRRTREGSTRSSSSPPHASPRTPERRDWARPWSRQAPAADGGCVALCLRSSAKSAL
jgi:hypothetical protein